jgi:hypothetical protein
MKTKNKDNIRYVPTMELLMQGKKTANFRWVGDIMVPIFKQTVAPRMARHGGLK